MRGRRGATVVDVPNMVGCSTANQSVTPVRGVR